MSANGAAAAAGSDNKAVQEREENLQRQDEKIPVTVLTGFLGSGKTVSLLRPL